MKARSSRIAAAAAVALLLVIGWVAVVGVSLDGARLAVPLARALGDALGRPVRIDAPVSLRLSLRPEAVMRRVAIENPPGHAARDFASIGEVGLAVDLMPLWRGEWRVRELRAREIEVRLARDADGTGNWMAPRDAAASGEEDRDASLPALDVHRVLVESLRVVLPDKQVVDVAVLEAEARRGEALRATLRGTFGGRAWDARVDGAPLDRLDADEPWAFEVRAALGDASMHGAGTVADALSAPRVAVRLGAGTPDVAASAAAFGIVLPPLGGAAIGADVVGQGTRWTIERSTAAVGQSAGGGRLVVDAGTARPRLSGAIALSRLDVAPLSGDAPDAADAPQTLAAAFRRLEGTDLDLRRHTAFDADVMLAIDDVDGVPGDLRDVVVRLVTGSERVSLPLGFMLAGARFSGTAEIDMAAQPARYAVMVEAQDAPFGGIAEVVFGAPYVDGRIRDMRFELDSAGERLLDLVQQLAVRARLGGAALTYGNFEGGVPVRLTIDRADLAQPRGGTLSGKASGTLLGRPLAGTLRAESVAQVVREGRTTFAFDAASGGVRATLGGLLTQVYGSAGPNVDVRISARRAAELAPWLGFSSASDMPVELRGTVQVRKSGTSLLGARADLGRSSLRGDVIRAQAGKRMVTRAAIEADRIDADELQGLAASPDARRTGVVDIPLLPAKLELGDADFDARVRRIDGLALSVTDVTLAGGVRAGVMPSAPLALSIEGVPLHGAVAADLAADVPRMQLWLQGRDVDIARWLRALGFGTNIEASAAALDLYADVRDTTVGRALDASSLLMNIGQGRLVVRDRNTKAAFRLRVESGEIRADPGEPVRVALDGRIFRAPITLQVATGTLRQFVAAKRVPIDLLMTGGGARLTVGGELTPRTDAPEVDLVVGLTGATFADLRPLLRTALPPWGPYGGAARLRISKWGYEVNDLRFAVGESVLEGRGALNTARQPKPLLDLALAASSIQLDDFPLSDWSPFDAGAAAAEAAVTKSLAQQLQEGADAAGAQVQALLDPELLAAHDANLALEVREVRSGRDRLGRGEARAKVAGGALEVEPVVVEMEGGAARLAGSYRPRGEEVETRARIDVKRFDYGVIARRLRPGTDIAGTFSLDLDVTGRSPRLAGAVARGSGHIDFSVWPERLHAGVFDLWATNVFLALLPALKADVTTVNCAIGEFDLKEGVLTSRRLLIDTTNTRAEGSALVNLPGNAIEARLVPQAKVPQFFALATPVEVTGTLDDFGVRVRPADVFATAARWATSLVVVPIRKLTETPPPADGRDVCSPAVR
jgi:uncharacterized protein involved in outer membrane biogenesis